MFFNYAVGANLPLMSQFTATASADIDADGVAQVWGYKKGSAAAKTHTCLLTELIPETVGPCLSTFSQSVF